MNFEELFYIFILNGTWEEGVRSMYVNVSFMDT